MDSSGEKVAYTDVSRPAQENYHHLREHLSRINAVVYQSEWENAKRWLGEQRLTPSQVKDMIQFGASKTFGFWQLDPETLNGLVREILGEGAMPPTPTPLRAPLRFQAIYASDKISPSNGRDHTGPSFAFRPPKQGRCMQWCRDEEYEGRPTLSGVLLFTATCGAGTLLVLVLSNNVGSQRLLDHLGRIPLYVARATAAGACLLTALLFFTMSKTALTACRYRNCKQQPLCGVALCCYGDCLCCCLPAGSKVRIFEG